MSEPAPTVLIVEDDPGIAELERGRLEEFGYRTRVAGTAEAAGREVAAGGIDLVLLDYRLPGDVDGLAFYQRLKAGGRDVPVILVTGFSDEGTVIRALRAGVKDFVTKSVEYLDYLPEAVHRVLAQVRTERRLAESEARFRSLVHSMEDIVFTLDRDGRHLGVFGRWADRHGLTPEAVLGRTVGEVLGPDAAAVHEEANRRALAGERVLYEWSTRTGGEVRWFQTALSPLRNGDETVAGVVGVGRDVTDQKRAEQALRESERRFRTLADHAPMLVWLADPDGQCTYVNRAWLDFTGRTPDQESGNGWADNIHPDDRDGVWDEYRDALAARTPFTLEYRLRRRDGVYRWVLDTGAPRFTDEGAFAGYIGSAVDISDRRQMEDAHRRSELLFRGVWDKSRDGMRLMDAAGTVRRVNDAYCRMVGLPRHALEGRPFTAAYAPEHRDGLLATYTARFAARTVEAHLARDLTLTDGRQVHLEASNAFLDLPGEPPLLLSVIRDLTAQRQLEEQFRQAQKMEAMGRLAGGVAHDFNNLLTVINGYAELLLGGDPPADQARDLLREVRGAGERAAGLTRQLLVFSRKQLVQPRVLDLNALIGETEKLLRRVIGEDVTLAVAPDPRVGTVKADPGQLEQVLMNLAVNARDAMPTGGRLSIATAAAEVGADRPDPEAAPGRYVRLSVTDTGHGMTPEVQAKIFEPFFTTKPAGKGTGLGLATVFGIVRQAGGFVTVESEPGRGTTFHVYLPEAEGELSPSKFPRRPVPTPPGTEVVLVVEDEDAVRLLVRLGLEGHGYTVLEAGTGEEAVRLAEGRPGGVHLLLTDVVMPGMSGREVAERVALSQPGLRVLFTSGYTDDAVVRHGVSEEEVAFLQKPFTPSVLLEKVREVLGGDPGPA